MEAPDRKKEVRSRYLPTKMARYVERLDNERAVDRHLRRMLHQGEATHRDVRRLQYCVRLDDVFRHTQRWSAGFLDGFCMIRGHALWDHQHCRATVLGEELWKKFRRRIRTKGALLAISPPSLNTEKSPTDRNGRPSSHRRKAHSRRSDSHAA